jgi:ribosome biogenesis protein SLX9
VIISRNNLFLRFDDSLSELQSSRSSSSKNQKRRLKKKQKEQVGGGLDAIQAAISALDGEGVHNIEQTEQVVDESTHPRIKSKPGQIGEGKGLPLKQNQRKRAL